MNGLLDLVISALEAGETAVCPEHVWRWQQGRAGGGNHLIWDPVQWVMRRHAASTRFCVSIPSVVKAYCWERQLAQWLGPWRGFGPWQGGNKAWSSLPSWVSNPGDAGVPGTWPACRELSAKVH